MKGFPKVIKTKSDLVNTFKLVKRGRLEKEDWLAAVEKLENQNWIMCPVIELSEDRKTVTIMYCAEVEEGQYIRLYRELKSYISIKTREKNRQRQKTWKQDRTMTLSTPFFLFQRH